MAGACRRLVSALILVAVLAWAGCSAAAGSSVDDSQIISALHLKRVSSGYEMHGSPFCRVDELLNDIDEVNGATEQKGVNFVIASTNGEAGVLAHPPFAPKCKREAKAALNKLARQDRSD
jgi:hypothetical protein